MEAVGSLPGLVDALGRGGLWPSLLAGAIVGLVLAVILLAGLGNVWGGVRARQGADTLQATLVAMVRDNRKTEEALRRRLDEAERDRAVTREELDETRAQIALLRHQRRRLITMLRDVIARLPEPAIRRRESTT